MYRTCVRTYFQRCVDTHGTRAVFDLAFLSFPLLQGDVKRTAEHREKLLQLLNQDLLQVMWSSSQQACAAIFCEDGSVRDEQYVFLKRMCQALVHLGTSQLGPLWVGGRVGWEKGCGYDGKLDCFYLG